MSFDWLSLLFLILSFFLGMLLMYIITSAINIFNKPRTENIIETQGDGFGMTMPILPSKAREFDWAKLATGESGWLEIEQNWLREAKQVYFTFCDKQRDYGPTNIGVGGAQGVTLRLGDKISRLFELLGLTSRKNAGNPQNEAIRDTWVDIADYGMIGLLVHDGKWPLVTPQNVWGKDAAATILLDMMKNDDDFFESFLTKLAESTVARELANDLNAKVDNENN